MVTNSYNRKGWRESNVAELKTIRPDDAVLPALQGLRSIAWKEYLLFESNDRTVWSSRLSESRTAYDALRSHFLRAIEHPDELGSSIDPLADTAESPWEALRRDETLRQEIFQDVERCMPENVYFRQPATQTMLLDVLFIFCKLNQDVGYRQGMHELLAPIVWVIERDALDSRQWKRPDIQDMQDDRLLLDLLDQRFIEHDAFTLFGLVMQNAKSFYEPSSGLLKRNSTQSLTDSEAPILVRVKRIYNGYLTKIDPELSSHLTKLDIVPQVFLMRWIRLLFGREFSFDDTLGIWDTVFAADPSLDIVDLICVAMLLRIRWQLIQADANTVLTLLLHYPSPEEATPPRTLVQDALYLKQNPNAIGGAHIIEKYSNRRPILPNHISLRPRTPSYASTHSDPSSPRRARSPFGSPTRFPSTGPTAVGLEGLLADAARAAYSRSEKWGFNRAVRDAVGEVKKNVQAIQSSPRNSLHRRTSSTDIFRKVERLEKRNQALAGMLETALSELWEYENSRKGETEAESLHESSGVKEAADELGIAIARVQFVQVYLTDASMPLPLEEKANKPVPPPEVLFDASAASSSPEPRELAPSDQSTAPQTNPIAIPQPPPSISVKSSSPPPRPIPTKSPPTVTTTAPTDVSSTPPSRPSLEQSPFSWILGHSAEDRQHAFASVAPFSEESTRRPSDRRGKGFLFGEDEAGKTEDSSEGKGVIAKGRRRVGVLRKKPPASVGSGGGAEAQGKGKGKTGADGADDESVDVEVIDMDAL
ncbi:RabGAP/TBC [Rhizodiscina lignyota]|uniref:RabGAP/TBC n=1 Tax=Rhizodiscina lignyota TaxID=1504668 RepID=A0A9P4INZ6_9PEZI|nr:RabGAP/TBC [Rhizodiscina lignyota]